MVVLNYTVRMVTWYLSVVMARVQKMVMVREMWNKQWSTGQML